MKNNLSGILVKTVFSLLIFVIFMILLSPVYVYRSVRLKVSYISSAKAELAILPARNLASALNERVKNFEYYSLDAADRSAQTVLELPSDNRIGCLWVRFRKIPHRFRICSITLVNGKREYPVQLKNFFVYPQDAEFVTAAGGQLQIRDARKLSIAFPLEELHRIDRDFDPVWALYMVLLSLLPAALVFYKTDAELKNLSSLLRLCYAAAAVFMLVFPILLIDYCSVISNENRFLNPFPEIFIHRRINCHFPQQFEKWFSDRFTGRKSAVANERKIFSPNFIHDAAYTSYAILCRNGWMFSRGFDSERMYQNRNRFTQEQLEACAENLKTLDSYLKRKKIRLYVMLTPDKERVYPEFYPARYKKAHPESRLEQLYRYLSAKTDLKIIFPLEELRKAKEKYRVYSKVGTHWTPRGAYAAFSMLHRALKKDFPELPSDQPNAEEWKPSSSADNDLARIAGYTDPARQLPADSLFQEIALVKCPYKSHEIKELSFDGIFVTEYAAEKPRKNALKVLALTDSFWGILLQYMFPCTNQMTHLFHGNGLPFNMRLFTMMTDRMNPDVVVVESTERFLDRFPVLTINGD